MNSNNEYVHDNDKAFEHEADNMYEDCGDGYESVRDDGYGPACDDGYESVHDDGYEPAHMDDNTEALPDHAMDIYDCTFEMMLEVEIFDGSGNFADWSEQVILALRQKGVLDYVESEMRSHQKRFIRSTAFEVWTELQKLYGVPNTEDLPARPKEELAEKEK
ncbi:hypothetical protein LPJ62_003442 [Coemansia sp. RSA 2167]|nr:hypothetical protein LPJ62_003442 [Coemansia sp. RSA 2167]